MIDTPANPLYNEAIMDLGPLGLCHICKFLGPIKFCPACGHWFCLKCRKRYFARGLEAIKQVVRGSQPGCCGPLGGEE